MRAKKIEEKPIEENGTGSYAAPYRRRDGTEMVKWGLSVPVSFAQRFRAFAGQLPLGVTASEWAVKTLIEAMEKQEEG